MTLHNTSVWTRNSNLMANRAAMLEQRSYLQDAGTRSLTVQKAFS